MNTARHYRFKSLEFYAERGLVHVIDERVPPDHPSAFVTVFVDEWLDRAKEINRNLHLWNRWPGERKELESYVANAFACAEDAKNQGRPDDPKAVADIMKDRRRTIFVGNGQIATSAVRSAETVPEGKLLPPISREKKPTVF